MPRDWSLPSLGVVIATYNRSQSLRRILQNIKDQNFLRFQDIEVCVVDDGSDVPADIDWGVFPFETKYIYRKRHPEGWPQVYSSRNIGVENTTGEVVLFLDDDLVFHNHTLWLMQFYHSLWHDIALIPHMSNPIDSKPYTKWFPARRNGEPGWITSAGLSVQRKWQEEIGDFFCEDFDGNMGFADRDLGIRLHEAGCEMVLANAIPMYIDDGGCSWRQHFLYKRVRGRADMSDPNLELFKQKHPNLRGI